MTNRQALNSGVKILKENSVKEAESDAWFLFEAATGMSKAHFFLDGEKEMTEEAETRYFDFIEKRRSNIPYQYITGFQDFMGFTFHVNENVLIPRLDTEILVEQALKIVKPGDRVLDMCTGSGCILLSIMSLADGIEGTGVDVSEDALDVARRNAKELAPNATLIKSDLFEKVKGKYNVIVSNPPYIRTAVIEELDAEVKNQEPRLALDGMEDGLYFYRRILQSAPSYLEEGGKLLFEIGYDQGQEVSDLMKEAGFMDICVIKDLAGLDRVVSGHL